MKNLKEIESDKVFLPRVMLELAFLLFVMGSTFLGYVVAGWLLTH